MNNGIYICGLTVINNDKHKLCLGYSTDSTPMFRSKFKHCHTHFPGTLPVQTCPDLVLQRLLYLAIAGWVWQWGMTLKPPKHLPHTWKVCLLSVWKSKEIGIVSHSISICCLRSTAPAYPQHINGWKIARGAVPIICMVICGYISPQW